MSNDTVNVTGEGMNDAINELVQRFRDGGEVTRNKIILTLAQRAQLAEKRADTAEHRLTDVKRDWWGGFFKLFSDDEIDEAISRILKHAEKKRK